MTPAEIVTSLAQPSRLTLRAPGLPFDGCGWRGSITITDQGHVTLCSPSGAVVLTFSFAVDETLSLELAPAE